MNKKKWVIFSFILFSLIRGMGYSQQISQKGKVLEYGDTIIPVSGVEIKFDKAKTTETDDNGIFVLKFSREVKVGDPIFLESIYKNGYGLVNQRDISVINISSQGYISKEIFLAKKDILPESKHDYILGLIEELEITRENMDSLYNVFKNRHNNNNEILSGGITLMSSILQNNRRIMNFYDFEKLNINILDNISIKNLTEIIFDHFSLISVRYIKPDYLEIKNYLENKRIEPVTYILERIIRSYSTESIIKDEQKLNKKLGNKNPRKSEKFLEELHTIISNKEELFDHYYFLAGLYLIDFNYNRYNYLLWSIYSSFKNDENAILFLAQLSFDLGDYSKSYYFLNLILNTNSKKELNKIKSYKILYKLYQNKEMNKESINSFYSYLSLVNQEFDFEPNVKEVFDLTLVYLHLSINEELNPIYLSSALANIDEGLRLNPHNLLFLETKEFLTTLIQNVKE